MNFHEENSARYFRVQSEREQTLVKNFHVRDDIDFHIAKGQELIECKHLPSWTYRKLNHLILETRGINIIINIYVKVIPPYS